MYPLDIPSPHKAGAPEPTPRAKEVITELLKLSDGGEVWSPKIRDFIQLNETHDPRGNLEAFVFLMRALLFTVRNGRADPVDLEDLVSDFSSSSIIRQGDNILSIDVVGLAGQPFVSDMREAMDAIISDFLKRIEI